MMKHVLVGLALLSQFSGATLNPAARRTDGVAGRYSMERANGSGCLLDMAEFQRQRIRFQLFCDRGAPSYNMGFIEGMVPIARGVAVFRDHGQGGVCELRITFRHARMEVVQREEHGGCGFGYGVTADGTYRRIRTRPAFDLHPGR